jgi:hypothetical protein
MKPTPKALASKLAHCEMSLVCLPRHLAKKGDITIFTVETTNKIERIEA